MNSRRTPAPRPTATGPFPVPPPTHVRRTPRRLRRLLGVVVALLVALLQPQLSAVPTATAAPPVQSSPDPASRVIHSQPVAPGLLGDDPPPSPTDAIGSPANATIVRTDQLAVRQTQDAESSTAANIPSWLATDSTLTKVADRAQGPADVSRPVLNQDYPMVTGRPLNPKADRSLTLQHVQLGGQGLYQVRTSDDDVLPSGAASVTTLTDDRSSFAGLTAALSSTDDGRTLVSASVVGDRGASVRVLREAPPNAAQQWSFLPSSTQAGWYRLVDRADGLCLDNLGNSQTTGTLIGTWTCSAPETDSQLWKPVSSGKQGGSVRWLVQNRGSKQYLADDGAGNLEQWPLGQGYTPTSFTLTQIGQPGGVVPTWSQVGTDNPAAPVDLAVGDLDRAVGPDSMYHDEAAVAFTDDQRRLQVRVLDYNRPGSALTEAAPTNLPAVVVGTMSGSDWFPGTIGVAIGDFDRDSVNEVAVTYQDAAGLHVRFFTYRQDGTNKGLRAAGEDRVIVANRNLAMVAGLGDVAAGNFDGTDGDELAVAYGQQVVINGQQLGTTFGAMTVARFDENLGVQASSAQVLELPYDTDHAGTQHALQLPPGAGTYTKRGIRLTAGLFVGSDPAHPELVGTALRQRQLAAVWTDRVQKDNDAVCYHDGNTRTGPVYATRDNVGAQLFRATSPDARHLDIAEASSPTLITSDQVNTVRWKDTAQCDTSNGRPYYRYLPWSETPATVAAGGFAGTGSGGRLPSWALAVGAPGTDVNDGQVLSSVRLFNKQRLLASKGGDDSNPLSPRARVAQSNDLQSVYRVAATDRLGQSLLLGAPVIFTLKDMKRIDVIAAGPPTHSDYRPDIVGTDHDGFLNISRTPSSFVNMTKSAGHALTSSTSSRKSTTIGGSEEFSTENTGKVGLPGIADSEVGVEVKEKVAAESEEETKDSATYERGVDTSIDTTTQDDDLLRGALVTSYVYRYPVLGALLDANPDDGSKPCTRSCHPVYEVHVPGPQSAVNAFGADLSSYQPTWQTGNVLSYPKLNGGSLDTSKDRGSFSVQGGGPVPSELFNQTNTFGAGKTKAELKVTEASAVGKEISATKSLKESGEVKVTAKGEIKFGPLAEGETTNTVALEVDASQTWGQMTTSESTTTTSQSFGMELEPVAKNQSYTIGTAYYYDKAGTQKVVHGVDLTSSAAGKGFWQKYYSVPDPALNLPLNTVMVEDGLGIRKDVKFNSLDERQKIRGFEARDAATGQLLASNPGPGTKLAFSVQVHNFSLAPARNVPVQFYAVPVVTTTVGNDTVVRPVGEKEPIGGPRSLQSLDGQGVSTVTSPVWTAPAPKGSDQAWRIFVDIDPDGGLAGDLHPLRARATDPADVKKCPEGAVEQGKALTDLLSPEGEEEDLACGQNNQGYGELTVSQAALTGARKPVRVDLSDHRLVVPTTGATVGSRLTGYVSATSDTGTADHHEVLVFDGAPEKGRLVSDVTLQGVPAKGKEAAFSWTPTSVGHHRLTAVLLDANGGATSRQLDVDVTKSPRPCPTLVGLPALIADLGPAVPERARMTTLARQAATATSHGDLSAARRALTALVTLVQSGAGKDYSTDSAAALVRDLRALSSGTCPPPSGTVARLSLSPTKATVRRNRPQPYTVVGYASDGQVLGDLTRSARVSIRGGGSCSRSTCRSIVVGPHTVVATYGRATATATLTVRR